MRLVHRKRRFAPFGDSLEWIQRRYFNVFTANMSMCRWLRRECIDGLDVYRFPLSSLGDWPLQGHGVALSDLSPEEASYYRWAIEFRYLLKLGNQGLP